ncbi:MAG TPA: hypothetical protein PKG61_09425 [Rhodoglobus sp.]|jgi:heme/copper-type cytochrome/quinol oxidase subunit 2|nr:hypothetical protein [Rhodoglobus sp.]HOW00576.1 hypothetical protein [Rhodoglobus sp.]HOY81962.1 hypothetical protein [Rhodoglobus sp.]
MMSLIALALAETEELAPLIMPPLAFAAIAVVVFVALAIVSWSFRDVSNRHTKNPNGSNTHGAGH